VTIGYVKVSPRFQVVIPRDVRAAMGLKPGQKLVVFHFENRIEMIPAEPSRSSGDSPAASTRASTG
jgi:AbrB family looped-hinge helix DNA binding protein